jgi:hypothetical protein
MADRSFDSRGSEESDESSQSFDEKVFKVKKAYFV